MANKIKLAGTTSNNFQIGLQGVTLYSNRATSPYNLSLPANSGSALQVIVSDGTGNLDWSNSVINSQTVTTNAQPNITSVGTLSSLSVSSNANIGNLGVTGVFATTLSATGNANIGNIGITGLVTATGAVTGGSLSTAGAVSVGGTVSANNVSATSNVNVGNLNAGATITLAGSGGAILTGPGLYVISGVGGLLRTIAGGNATFIQSGIYNTSNSAAPLRFTTIGGAREWMRLDENGNLGINVSGPTSTLHVVGTANVSGATLFGSTVSAAGNITGANLITNNYTFVSVGTGLTATGTTQGTGLALTKSFNEVTTVASSANSVVLPTAVAGMSVVIRNASANILNVFPATGASIDTLAINTANTVSANTTAQYWAISTTKWYSK